MADPKNSQNPLQKFRELYPGEIGPHLIRGTPPNPNAVKMGRVMRGYQYPHLAPLALPYEAMKLVEQSTGIPTLGLIATLMEKYPKFASSMSKNTSFGNPSSFKIDESTAPASAENAFWTDAGAFYRMMVDAGLMDPPSGGLEK